MNLKNYIKYFITSVLNYARFLAPIYLFLYQQSLINAEHDIPKESTLDYHTKQAIKLGHNAIVTILDCINESNFEMYYDDLSERDFLCATNQIMRVFDLTNCPKSTRDFFGVAVQQNDREDILFHCVPHINVNEVNSLGYFEL